MQKPIQLMSHARSRLRVIFQVGRFFPFHAIGHGPHASLYVTNNAGGKLVVDKESLRKSRLHENEIYKDDF